MPPYVLDTIAPLIGMLGIGTMALIGFKLWLDAKTARLSGGGAEEVRRLTETVERLDEQVRMLQDHFTDLDERLEFTERVLARSAEKGGRLGAGDR